MVDSVPHHYIRRTRFPGGGLWCQHPPFSSDGATRCFPSSIPSRSSGCVGSVKPAFAQGEAIFTAGQVGPGLVVILSGEVDIVRHEFSRESLIVMDGPGQFMGELAQLAGRPALVDAVATKPVQALSSRRSGCVHC